MESIVHVLADSLGCVVEPLQSTDSWTQCLFRGPQHKDYPHLGTRYCKATLEGNKLTLLGYYKIVVDLLDPTSLTRVERTCNDGRFWLFSHNSLDIPILDKVS